LVDYISVAFEPILAYFSSLFSYNVPHCAIKEAEKSAQNNFKIVST